MATYAVKIERTPRLVLPRHSDAPADGEFVAWCAEEKAAGRRLAVDLFSGAGGLGLGLEAAGWTVVAAVDDNQRALETHLANFRGLALSVDMGNVEEVSSLIDLLKPLDIDLVAGGPPCQPFSRAGRAKIRSLVEGGNRTEHDSRKELWRSFVRVALELRPRAVIMENVPDMAIGDDVRVVREIADQFERGDYDVSYKLLDAWRFGVPQHRKRFIMQARRDGESIAWPSESEKRTVVRDAIEDLPRLRDTTGSRELKSTGRPRSDFAKAMQSGDAPEVVFDHVTRPVRSDDREAFALMDSKTLYSDLPERLRRYSAASFNDKYKRLDWDDLSRTITAHIAKDGYWYIHPEEHRTLTVREAARIQTFPDAFRFSGTRSDAFRQIGNAVPPMLGAAVAQCLAPSAGGRPSASRHADMIEKLDSWALNQRGRRWWLFPGKDMTPPAAYVAALLDVHRLSDEVAQVIMQPLKGSIGFAGVTWTLDELSRVPPVRRERIGAVTSALGCASAEAEWERLPKLTPSQERVREVLLGGETLILNDHVAQIVCGLLGCDADRMGLGTDVRVALAQIVGRRPWSAIRMAAIRAMPTAVLTDLFSRETLARADSGPGRSEQLG